jgi:hypothetical protein
MSGETLIKIRADTVWERWAASSRMTLMGGGELFSVPRTFNPDENNLV